MKTVYLISIANPNETVKRPLINTRVQTFAPGTESCRQVPCRDLVIPQVSEVSPALLSALLADRREGR